MNIMDGRKRMEKNMRLKLDFELHKKFKIKALQDDKTLQEKIIELITKYVEGE
jgi:predicted HicB family RNase H-like nuclease